MLITLKKLISLGLFYLKSISAFFRPNTQWNLALVKDFFVRLFYYICNWCYLLFLSLFEGLLFGFNRDLINIETQLYNHYFKINQFYIALRDGLKLAPKDITSLTYGETSWFAIKGILDTVQATNNDIFYDLGCGTGRTVFFARIYYGLKKAVGIDIIPTFIETAQKVALNTGMDGVSFIKNDILKTSLKNGTIFLAVITVCYNNAMIEQLKSKLKEIPSNSWVITVSCPLICDHLKVVQTKYLFYSWGIAKTFFHKKI